MKPCASPEHWPSGLCSPEPPVARRRPVMLAMVSLVVLLGGCGFRPMYGERPAATASAPAATPVAAEFAVDRRGTDSRSARPDPAQRADVAAQSLRRAPSSDKRYTLRVNTKEIVDTFAVERSGFATAASVEIIATYTLVEDATGKAGARRQQPRRSPTTTSSKTITPPMSPAAMPATVPLPRSPTTSATVLLSTSLREARAPRRRIAWRPTLRPFPLPRRRPIPPGHEADGAAGRAVHPQP